MRITSVSMTEENHKKIKDHKQKLIKNAVGKVTFSDALNNLLEKL